VINPQEKTAEAAPQLSLVVPLYNEAESLVELHEAIASALAQIPDQAEIIYVDDGSDDHSFDVILGLSQTDPRVRGIQLRRRYGKSAALTVGFERSRGDVLVTLDADLQDDPSEIPSLLRQLDQGFDMVCGWRQRRADGWTKRAASSLFNWIVASVSGVPLHDFNTGLKVFYREVAQEVRLYGELHRYLPLLAAQQGFHIGEIPVVHHARRHGRSKYTAARYVSSALDLLAVLFLIHYRVRPLRLFGLPGLILMLVGGIICLWLAWGRLVHQHYLSNRPLLLLGLLLLVLGLQFFSIGLLGEAITAVNADKLRYSVRRDTGGQ
jgi:glycosyltransferase involved in cell wall biosynthesis